MFRKILIKIKMIKYRMRYSKEEIEKADNDFRKAMKRFDDSGF